MTCLQLIVRYAWAEMMDVMEADISREPLQQFGEFIEGTAVHACIEEFPIRMTFPIRRVKIVLDVEQPNS